MTNTQAKQVLKSPYKPLVLSAISFVNLTDKEISALILHYLRGHTQEETAEELNYSVDNIKKIEKAALDKCCKAWENLVFVKEILNHTQ